MTDEIETKAVGKAPGFIAYHVKDSKSDEAFYTRIGAAFAHKKGGGYTLLLDVIPLSGEIALFLPKPKAK